jgi:hypothetical protein
MSDKVPWQPGFQRERPIQAFQNASPETLTIQTNVGIEGLGTRPFAIYAKPGEWVVHDPGEPSLRVYSDAEFNERFHLTTT